MTTSIQIIKANSNKTIPAYIRSQETAFASVRSRAAIFQTLDTVEESCILVCPPFLLFEICDLDSNKYLEAQKYGASMLYSECQFLARCIGLNVTTLIII